MKINDIVAHLESVAPLKLQESYDNCGLQVGDGLANVVSALVCVDLTDGVLQEAINGKHGLVIMHHPLIFSGLKRLTGEDHVQRMVLTAVRNNIALYAIHTNLDNVIEGVNGKLAQKLGIVPIKVLKPISGTLRKLVVFVPMKNAEALRQALFAAGAGAIGDYDGCSFNTSGIGTFRPGESTQPHIGDHGKQESVEEQRVEVIVPFWKLDAVLKAMDKNHPYEVVAHDIYRLENEFQLVGAGIIGELEKEMTEVGFLEHVKHALKAKVLRHSVGHGLPIKKVAVCGGSGSFLIQDAIRAGADAFITGDLKYHQFQEPDGRMLLIDAGHYETEQYTMELIGGLLAEKFTKFAVRFTEQVTNPIHYF